MGISSATATRTNATLRGQRRVPGDHLRLDVVFTLPTAAGFVEMRVEGAVADSGAQLTIIPETHLHAGRNDLCNVSQLSAASGAK